MLVPLSHSNTSRSNRSLLSYIMSDHQGIGFRHLLQPKGLSGQISWALRIVTFLVCGNLACAASTDLDELSLLLACRRLLAGHHLLEHPLQISHP